MARRSDFGIVASVYGGALVRLARAVGLSQAQLAAYLGVSPMQVTHWRHGKEPMCPGKLVLVVKRLQEALAHTLASRRGEGKPELAAILNDIFHENLAALGFPLYPSLKQLLAQLAAASSTFADTKNPTPVQHAELKMLSGAVNLLSGILNDCAELFFMLDCPELRFISDATEDHYADTDTQPTQGPGYDENDPGAHSGTGGAHAPVLDVEQS